MLKNIFIFFCLCFYTAAIAQVDNNTTFARYIKILPTDSLLELKEPVKNQLTKLISIKRPQRLIFTDADKNVNITNGRWLAARQKQDLYRVNLSSLVSKYIGETEKNLEQVFNKAEEKNWVLFFDEADALFGKRTDTNPTTEKESSGQAYFLKRIKEFKGTVIISCSGENCITKTARQNFITVK